jgi:hypothetical protein
LKTFFYFGKYKVSDKFKNKKITFFSQYNYYNQNFENVIILMEVGKYFRLINKTLISFDYSKHKTKKYFFYNIPKNEIDFIISKKQNTIYLIIKQTSKTKPIRRNLDCIIFT